MILISVLLCAGIVAATAYFTPPTGGTFTGKSNNALGGVCGFVSLSSTDVVGGGSQSGPNYISFSPAINALTVTQTVTATLNEYGTGSSGYEYLIDELGFGCTSVSAGVPIPITLSASALGASGNWKWVAMEVSYSANNPSVNPLYGTPCDHAGGNLFLPTGAYPSVWNAAGSNYTGGNTYVYSANQTGGAHLTDDSCTANAAAGHTTIPTLVPSSTSSSLVIFLYISFVITGASATTAITNPAFTLGFT